MSISSGARNFGGWLREIWPFLVALYVIARLEMILAASSEAADHADSARVTASRAFEMAREARDAADEAESAARSVDCD